MPGSNGNDFSGFARKLEGMEKKNDRNMIDRNMPG
jgi:hypothetical protein